MHEGGVCWALTGYNIVRRFKCPATSLLGAALQKKKKVYYSRESNPDRLLGRQLYCHCTTVVPSSRMTWSQRRILHIY